MYYSGGKIAIYLNATSTFSPGSRLLGAKPV
jgi:hypothetical protein